MSVEWDLVGRDEELHWIERRLTRADRFGVLISGQPGVGKTRVAREALATAAEVGRHTEWIAATRSAALLPFGALLPLAPIDDPNQIGGETSGPVETIASALRVRSGGRPVTMVIDDVHLLDDTTAAIVHFLASTRRATLILTHRSTEPLPEAVAAMVKDSGLERLEIQALSESEIGSLMTQALGGPVVSGSVHQFAVLSSGNPLMLREILTRSIDAGSFRFSGQLWHWEGVAAEGLRLHDLISEHVVRIDGPARDALDLVCFGESLRLDTLMRLTTPDVLESLVADNLVVVETVSHQRVVRLAHPLYGEALRAETLPSAASRLQQRLVDAVLDEGTLSNEDILRVARFWLETEQPGQPEIFERAAILGRSADSEREVVRFAKAALAHRSAFGSVLSLAEATALVEYPRVDGQLFWDARALASTDDELVAWAVAVVRPMGNLWRLPSAEKVFAAVDDVLAEISDPLKRDIVRGQLAISMMHLGRVAEAEALARSLLDSPSDLVKVRALTAAGFSLIMSGEVGRITALAEELFTRSADYAERYRQGPYMSAYIFLAGLFALGRFSEIPDLIQMAGFEHPENYPAWIGGSVLLAQGKARLMMGEVEAAIALLRESYDLFALANDFRTSWAASLLVEALSVHGDVGAADRVAAAVSKMSMFEPSVVDSVRAVAWHHVAQGDLATARWRLLEHASNLRAQGRRWIEMITLHDALRVGADDVAWRIAELAEGMEGTWSVGCALHARAAQSDRGEDYERAAAHFEGMSANLIAGELYGLAGAAFAREGVRSGAARCTNRARELLARCQHATTPLSSLEQPVDPLTDRERQVAVLAAAGRTDGEIAQSLQISVRTVGNLLGRAYRKLGINSRTSLADALGQGGADGDHSRSGT